MFTTAQFVSVHKAAQPSRLPKKDKRVSINMIADFLEFVQGQIVLPLLLRAIREKTVNSGLNKN